MEEAERIGETGSFRLLPRLCGSYSRPAEPEARSGPAVSQPHFICIFPDVARALDKLPS